MPINSKYITPFIPHEFYHVYNRCPSNKKMFIEKKDYFFFLDLIKKYLVSHADIYAYSLIPNHFHLFIRIKEVLNYFEKIDTNQVITNQFRKLFISYTTSFNKQYGIHGSLFSTPFRRIMITSDSYLSQLIYYIHYNAIHHNICTHPSQYLFSSYNSIISDKLTLLRRKEVLSWFGGIESFIKSHELMKLKFINFPFCNE